MNQPAKITTIILPLLALTGLVACTPKLDNEKNGMSYSVGYALGQQLTKVKDDIDPKIVAMGLTDGIEGKPKLEEAKLAERLTGLQGKQREREQGEAAITLKASQAYMATVAAKQGIQKIDETVYYEVVKAGTGKKSPGEADHITVTYVGKKTDGVAFDQANDAGLAFKELQLPGLKKAIGKMVAGDQWTIYLAPEAAFGMNMRPGVPLQSAVIYDLTLTDLGHKEPAKPAGKK